MKIPNRALSAQTHRTVPQIRFDVLSSRRLALQQNRLTAVPTAEQSIGGVLVTFNIGEDQTQTRAYSTAAALREHPATMDSAAETRPQTSASSCSAASRYREADVLIQRAASVTSFLRAFAFGWG